MAAISTVTATTSAAPTAIRKPTKMPGKAAGMTTFTMRAASPMRSSRATSRSRGFTPRTAAMVSSSTGQNEVLAISDISIA